MTQGTFFNLDYDKPIYWKFLIIHLFYMLIWISAIFILMFRGDYFLLEVLSDEYEWVINAVPLFFFVVLLVIMLKSKWYYNLVLIFYPILLILWFIPKTVLLKGKIYLFFGYINFLYNRFKKFKTSIINFFVIIILLLLLIVTSSVPIKIFGILYFTYLYLKIVYKYFNRSLKPVQLFGRNVEDKLNLLLEKPEESYSMIKPLEEVSTDDKLEEDVKRLKRINRLIIINSVIEYIGKNLDGIKGRRAYIYSWIYQLMLFVVITSIYFTFVNFQLNIIDSSSFKMTVEPCVFNFLYYTIKTFVFANIESIVPLSIAARIVEISSFLIVGVFVLIIITSVIYSFQHERMNQNIKKAGEVCASQNKYIAKLMLDKYGADIQTVIKETGTIKDSIENIKKIISRII